MEFEWQVLFCAAIRRDSISLFMFNFLSHFLVFEFETLFVSRLERPYSCFSFHFFSGYFCSADPRVASIVSDGGDQSSSMLFL